MTKRKGKKLTANQIAYRKQVKRIKQFIARAEKRGYTFEKQVIPPTPKRITKKAIERVTELNPEKLYSLAKYKTVYGEILTGTERRKQERKETARKSAETRRKNKESAKEFFSEHEKPNKEWTREDAEKNKSKLPNGGKTVYMNTLQEFILKLSQPVPQYTPFGSGRNQKAFDASQTEKTTLYNLTMRMVNEHGMEEIGWRIQEGGDELDDLLSYVLYGSKAEGIQTASAQIARIIKGSELSMQERIDLAQESESEENWELPE